MQMKASLFARSVTCLTLLCSALSIKASLVQANSPRFGQNALTIDTGTSLAWLDLPFSTGYSYQQAVAATGAGGVFEGFGHATAQEVLTLYADAGIPGTGIFPLSSAQPILSLISLVGATGFQDTYPEAIGISATPFGVDARLTPGFDFFYDTGVPSYVVSGLAGHTPAYGDTTSSLGVGNRLVYQVPEPASSMLAVIGTMFIFGTRIVWRRLARRE
jgi:hypothetical protein